MSNDLKVDSMQNNDTSLHKISKISHEKRREFSIMFIILYWRSMKETKCEVIMAVNSKLITG